MTDDFFDFLKEPTKEAFLKARAYVIENEAYNPYSDDINQIESLLQKEAYEEVMAYHNINVILSPRVHLMKKFAATQLGDEDAAQAEYILGYRILEGIMATGDGSKEHPYMVLRVNDERDFLSFIGEEFQSQALIKEDKTYDLLTTTSGKSIYFDITDSYKKIASYSFGDMLDSLGIDEDDLEDVEDTSKQKTVQVTKNQTKKKWWKFW